MGRSEEYVRKVIPHLKPEYFEGADKKFFEIFYEYFNKYNKVPTGEILEVEIGESTSVVDESEYNELIGIVGEINSGRHEDKIDQEWLLDATERFCLDRSVYLGITKSIKILDGSEKDLDKGAIPDILREALSVSFDTKVGHSFTEEYEDRFDFYTHHEEKFEFDIDYLNKITDGGVPKKSLCLLLGGTGTGKTLVKCHLASSYFLQGKNVLYITMEMAEERIAQRIDANILNMKMGDLSSIPKETYVKRWNKLKEMTKGRLVIKEYPTASAHVGHFRYLLRELKTKQNFVPDIIFIDYLNICASQRMKMGGSVNSYTYIKSVAEELRGLAIEMNCPIWTSTQTNRDGLKNSDPDLTNTSESAGIAHTADLMIALVTTEELEEKNLLLFKQLKNRYGPLDYYRRFVVKIDRSRMKLSDADAEDNSRYGSASKDDGPVVDIGKEVGSGDKDDVFGGLDKKGGKTLGYGTFNFD